MGKPRTNKTLREGPRSRTFTGCGTCRSRHLKCDEARPACSTCKRLNLPCQGYAPRLLWIETEQHAGPTPSGKKSNGSSGGQGESSYRYPLFTEKHRRLMSVDIVKSLGGQSAGDALVDMDAESVPDDDLRAVGPFGVFRVLHRSVVEKECEGDVTEEEEEEEREENSSNSQISRTTQGRESTPRPRANIETLDLTSEEVEELPFTLEQQQTAADFSSDPFFSTTFRDSPFASFAADIAGPDTWMRMASQPAVDLTQGIFSDGFGMGLFLSPLGSPRDPLVTQPSSPKPQQTTPTEPAFAIPEASQAVSNSTPSSSCPEASSSTNLTGSSTPRKVHSFPESQLPIGGSILPLHAALLLRFLKGEVLEGPSSALSRRGMSPWKLLILPCAFEAFAEMSLWNATTYTRRSILCTLLAKSAFHLSKSMSLQDVEAAAFWLAVGANHQHDAQEHLKSALRKESGGKTEVKYTEVLMAILGVGVVSVHFTGPNAVKKLLLEAECFIRLRGIPATKTFGHRVLHHMYTHLRVMIESTNIIQEPTGGGWMDAPSLDQVLESATSPRKFGVNQNSLGDLDTTRHKPEDVGYNDIHLDVSGCWPPTLYPELYGVPETLMTLLSQTISLVNEKPKLEAAALADPAVSLALSQHIKTLERQIWSWSLQASNMPAGPRLPPSLVNEESQPLDRPQAESMALAMHGALIIYFYRRVYNMSVMIVQDQVRRTLELIQPCLAMGQFDADFSVSIGWSAFIAACEAATPELQEMGLRCLESIDDHGLLVERGGPSAVARAVWERRKQTGDFTFGWPDLMRQGESPLAI